MLIGDHSTHSDQPPSNHNPSAFTPPSLTSSPLRVDDSVGEVLSTPSAFSPLPVTLTTSGDASQRQPLSTMTADAAVERDPSDKLTSLIAERCHFVGEGDRLGVDGRRPMQCVCGMTECDPTDQGGSREIVQCTICASWQHASCMNYDLSDELRAPYKCPHCHYVSLTGVCQSCFTIGCL